MAYYTKYDKKVDIIDKYKLKWYLNNHGITCSLIRLGFNKCNLNQLPPFQNQLLQNWNTYLAQLNSVTTLNAHIVRQILNCRIVPGVGHHYQNQKRFRLAMLHMKG